MINSQQKEPAIPMEVPSWPRKIWGKDLLLYNNEWYLLVAKYYGEFPWVQKLSAACTKDEISVLTSCFSIFFTPDKVICDNDTQFTSMVYKEFATNWGFTLATSSPH